MPRDLDAVLDGMGWQLDDTERADMHKLQVATLLAWGVHPDSIGPTRKGRGYIAQAMADAQQQAATADAPAPVAFVPRGPSDCDTDPVQTCAAHIALTPAETQSGMDRVRWAENLIRQLPEDHDGRNSWLLNYARGPVPPSAPSEPLEQLEFFQRVEALADRVTRRPAFADVWGFDTWSLRVFAQALRSSESRTVGVGMLHLSIADGDKLAEALRLAKPGPVVLESAPPIAPKFDEAVKVLQAWGYSFTLGKWTPPERAPFYVKRANVSQVRRGSPPATGVVLVASLDTVSIPGDWVAVYPGPAEAVRQATAEEVFLAQVLDEVLRARAKFPGDRVMGLALAEEFGELIKAVLDESPERVRKEAVQTAAMCVRLVLDGDGSVKEWRAARGLAPMVQPKEGGQL